MFKSFNPGGHNPQIYFSSTPSPQNQAEEFIFNPSYRPNEVLKRIKIDPIFALPTNIPVQGYQMIFHFPNDTRLDMPLPMGLTNKGNVTTGFLINFQADSSSPIFLPVGLRNVTPIHIYNVPDPNTRGAFVITFEIGKENKNEN